MVHEQYRAQIRLCTASFAYSTAIMAQLVFGVYYPELLPAQFALLGVAWLFMLSMESDVLEQTDYGPHFVATRSFVGMNALFSIVAGEDLEPMFTSYDYELTAFLGFTLLVTLLVLSTTIISARSTTFMQTDQ